VTVIAVVAVVAVIAILVVAASFGATAGRTGAVETASTVEPQGVPALMPAASQNRSAAIVAVLPNPTADGDAGEYVAVRLPPGNWVLSDGETTVRLRGPGRVVVTATPRALPNGTAGRVVTADLGLANGGERLRLAHVTANSTANSTASASTRTGRTVHIVRYREAPPGHRWLPAERVWQPVGYEPRSVVALGASNVTAFVLPDAPAVPIETIRSADERILLAGYTFASERVAAALERAAARGVTVKVLLDADPVGGISERQAALLTRLHRAGIPVELVGGDAARFRFHHPKYAVVDDRALVMTENWKPAGTGGNGSRGWGVRLDSDRAASELAAVFRHDWRGSDARPWPTVRRGRTFEHAPPARESFPRAFAPETFRPNATFLLTAPGNAGSGVVSVLDTADRRIEVTQPTIERGRLLTATKRAAERGVTVRILVSGAWYVEEDNRALVASLNDWAQRTGAPLTAKIVDPGDAFGKIHAKGVVADDTVVVGSLNWNPTSAGENREVAVALRGNEVANYYSAVFTADWRGPEQSSFGALGGEGIPFPPLLAIAGVGAVAGVALLLKRRIRFAEETRR
jgi:phosphatidylserine/phosphatidylglycerophosphate/cardiolipin synthase-like enzyme